MTIPHPLNIAFDGTLRRHLEKSALCKQAYIDRMKTLQEFTDQLQEEQLREIAALKKDLGMDLTEEELGRLQQDSS